MSFNFNIMKIETENEKNFLNGVTKFGKTNKMLLLGLNGEKTAVLLNNMLNWRFNSCKYKNGRRNWGEDPANLVGGGLIVVCNARITINASNQVGIFFNNFEKRDKVLRNACGEAEIFKSIKDKIANELKKYWTSINKHNEPITMYFDDQSFEVTVADYRVVYEILKSRDVDKIKGKYGANVYNEMIGNSVEDQFVISAIETIKNEISNVAKQRDIDCENRKKKHTEESNRLYDEFKADEAKIKSEANAKIKEMEEQIKALISAANNNF